jgi:hypothetical protein
MCGLFDKKKGSSVEEAKTADRSETGRVSSKMSAHQRNLQTAGDYTLEGNISSFATLSDDGALTYDGTKKAVWSHRNADIPYMHKGPKGAGFIEQPYAEIDGSVMKITDIGRTEVILYLDGNQAASGTVTKEGEVKRTYKWRYRKGNTLHSFSLEFAFPYSAYSAFTDPKYIRNSLGKNQIPFTVVTDEIKRLSDQLRKRYIKTFRSDPIGQDYADYLLAFVQGAIAYPDRIPRDNGDLHSGDYSVYGKEEYWAFGMETLFRGTGDCEDTSILFCTLASAAGFKSCLGLLKSHAVAGVVLDRFRNQPSSLAPSYRGMKDSDDVIYFCETTFKDPSPVGYVDKRIAEEISDLRSVRMIEPGTGKECSRPAPLRRYRLEFIFGQTIGIC